MSIKSRYNIRMKLRSDQKVVIDSSFGQGIIAGPVINRYGFVWEYYDLFLTDDSLRPYNVGFPEGVEIITTYGDLVKAGCKIDYMRLLKEESQTPLTDQDLVDDLEYMQKEIEKCDKLVKKYQNKDDEKKSEFFFNLVNVNTYKMFLFNSEKDYEDYIKRVRIAVNKKNSDFMAKYGDALFSRMDQLSKKHKRKHSFV